jgi:aldose sugar dehydrogenase
MANRLLKVTLAVAGGLLLQAQTVTGAERALMANGYPVAPTGLENIPLGKGPFQYPTAEGQSIRVTVLARGLEHPYSLAFLPNGDLLFTERPGHIRLLRKGSSQPVEITGGPGSKSADRSGLVTSVHGYMSMVLHPRFAENHLVYFAYNKPLEDKTSAIQIARARLDGDALKDVKDVLNSTNLRGTVSLVFTPDNNLWIATAATGGNGAQDPGTLDGKVLRVRDDGSVPSDNPFVGKAGYRPEIYSIGHRSCMGLTVHPTTGQVWLSEMGPNGGDEINIIKPGANYGWPLVSLGRTYPGPWQSKGNQPTHDGYEMPVVYWTPSISVSGLTFYTGDKFPKWKGDLFVGGVRYGEVPGTGRLDRVLLSANQEELRRESLLADLHQRIRDVKQGPDGLLYVATDEPKGAILRIEPLP